MDSSNRKARVALVALSFLASMGASAPFSPRFGGSWDDRTGSAGIPGNGSWVEDFDAEGRAIAVEF